MDLNGEIRSDANLKHKCLGKLSQKFHGNVSTLKCRSMSFRKQGFLFGLILTCLFSGKWWRIDFNFYTSFIEIKMYYM